MPVHPIYKRIGELIKTRRNTLQMRQKNLASTLSISRGALANIETGRQSILVHQLYNIATALQLSPFDLLPPPASSGAGNERTALPLPSDLKSQQRQQVTQLIMQVDTNQKMKTEVSHAKRRKG